MHWVYTWMAKKKVPKKTRKQLKSVLLALLLVEIKTALKCNAARGEEDEPHTRCPNQCRFVDCNTDCSLNHSAARQEGDGLHTCHQNQNLFLDRDTFQREPPCYW